MRPKGTTADREERIATALERIATALEDMLGMAKVFAKVTADEMKRRGVA